MVIRWQISGRLCGSASHRLNVTAAWNRGRAVPEAGSCLISGLIRGLELKLMKRFDALVNLNSIPAPAGEMEVVLGSGWPGVMLHEAVGHGLEGDFNRKGTSLFSGRIGEQVAAKGVTVVDDGTMDDRRGSITIDDEGTPSARNG